MVSSHQHKIAQTKWLKQDVMVDTESQLDKTYKAVGDKALSTHVHFSK